jgi:(1->4)-alpha-D-glucan 1-alpha-D-glucosylmutase
VEDRRAQPAALENAPQPSPALAECLEQLAARRSRSRPLATYRLQLNARFGCEQARLLVPYLEALGVSDCYTSPILESRRGSPHGYDIIDHNQIDAEIGGEAGFRALSQELRARGMGLLLDVVPNHMGVGQGTNRWWQDVLEHGRASEFADYFDIDWEPLKPELRGKILLPVLGDQYGAELEQGRIQVGFEAGRFQVRYFDKRMRVDPQTLPVLFEGPRPAQGGDGAGASLPSQLRDLLAELARLPHRDRNDPEALAQRRREAPRLAERLAALAETPAVREAMEHALAAVNGRAGEPHSFDALHHLLEAQAWRLADWRVSAEEINYRRFFDVNDLVGLRMEHPQVFADTHRLIRRLLAESSVTGLRVDHPDGLLNPLQYFTRLQMLYAASQCLGAEPQGEVAENGIERAVQEAFARHPELPQRRLLHLVVEKILEPGEDLPAEWPVEGTVGYDFTNQVNGIFVERTNQRPFTNLYHRMVEGLSADVETLIYDSKKLIMETSLSSEVTVLSHLLDELSNRDRRARDFTRKALTDAIRETIACFPVYRTYIDERGNVGEHDRAHIQLAIARAKRRNESRAHAIFDWLRDILLLQSSGGSLETYRRQLYFTLKFQQLTGPVMAKGLEDTACYVYNRFLPSNEVGGSPRLFGTAVSEFHQANQQRAARWPYSMLATSTHDTKRSEDVRARLDVLSEMPKTWSAQVTRWRRLNRVRKLILGDGRAVPDANEEYLLYQSLVGIWPWRHDEQSLAETTRRLQDYMTKAVHEAKRNLSWVNPNPEYVEALRAFIERMLSPTARGKPNPMLEEVAAFVQRIALFGALNSIAQVLLKAASPGVPDFYQGSELWNLHLVDPDNRCPVDFERHQHFLAEMEQRARDLPWPELCSELLRDYADGRVKLWTTLRALRLRRERAEVFREGSYVPLEARGGKQQHICAFARRQGTETVIVAVPRLTYTLMKGEPRPPLGAVWDETAVPLPEGAAGRYRNVFTGEEIAATDGALLGREIFACFPLALLAQL